MGDESRAGGRWVVWPPLLTALVRAPHFTTGGNSYRRYAILSLFLSTRLSRIGCLLDIPALGIAISQAKQPCTPYIGPTAYDVDHLHSTTELAFTRDVVQAVYTLLNSAQVQPSRGTPCRSLVVLGSHSAA